MAQLDVLPTRSVPAEEPGVRDVVKFGDGLVMVTVMVMVRRGRVPGVEVREQEDAALLGAAQVRLQVGDVPLEQVMEFPGHRHLHSLVRPPSFSADMRDHQVVFRVHRPFKLVDRHVLV